MSEELKPCPFCGGEVENVKTFKDRYVFYQILFFKCKKCGAVVSFDNANSSINYMNAVETWNRRANDE